MGGLTGAVHWWEEWQLRVLVLTSMAIQFFLFSFPFLRRRAIPRLARSILWLAYIGSDAVAIYALATLFNRHKAAGEDGGGGGGGGGSNSMLEVFWAPILLLHLGGHDGVTAYNIEDNELWSRHLLTAVSQVTVAIYVFCKTWPPGGDKRLLQAAILLFVPGVLKCLLKPWALKEASIYSLVSSPASVKQKEEEMYPLEEYVRRAKDFVVRAQKEEGEAQEGARSSSSMEEEEEGRHRPSGNAIEPAGTAAGRSEWKMRQMQRTQRRNEMSKLFVDLSCWYSHRLSILEDFCGFTPKRAYGSVRHGLATAFLLLYTKLKSVDTIVSDAEAGLVVVVGQLVSYYSTLLSLRMFLPWAAIGLFQHSHREAYNDIDVKITYVILCCTAALEFLSIGSFKDQVKGMKYLDDDEWPETVAQRSFIGLVARSTTHSNKIMRIVSRLWLGCKDFLDQQYCFSSHRITGLVQQYLKAGWKQQIHDAASYRRFNDNRGHWALEGYQQELGWSIKGPLDESVLLWHIATDLCFFLRPSSSDHICAFDEIPSILSRLFDSDSDSDSEGDSHLAKRTSPTSKCGEELTECKSVLCRQISDYMAYLLLVNPEMLLPGSRRNLCTRGKEELEAIFNNNGDKPPQGLNRKELAQKIVSALESSSSSSSQQGGSSSAPPQETFVHQAWKLAQALRRLGDQKMWEVIQGVWVEMLCYSAGRCRGYLHAKALGQGGEFLSYVWLMMFYMGMETFTDKLQREELPSHGAAATGNSDTAAPPSTTSDSEQVTSTAGNAAASEGCTDKPLQREDFPIHEADGTGNSATTAPPSTTSERVPSIAGIAAASASEFHTDAAAATTAAPSTSKISTPEDMV